MSRGRVLALAGLGVLVVVLAWGMGWYTGQPNDPPATISREEQQARIVDATVALLRSLDEAPD